MDAKKLSDEIRAAVIASKLSQYAIAKAIGVSRSTMSRFVSGKGGLSLGNIDQLARLLGLHVISEKQKDN
jgi:transcriptional regulator with XRE-family HTH domain